MKILNKLTIKSLKMNPVRTTATIVGIALSAALIVATIGLATSFQQSLIKASIENVGNHHVTFYGVPVEELVYLQNHVETKEYYMVENMGFGLLEGSGNESKPYMNVLSVDAKALQGYENKLLDGRLPEASGEILVSQYMLDTSQIDYVIGDQITAQIGTRISEGGEELHQGHVYGEYGVEYIEGATEQKFTIVGVIDKPSFEAYSSPGYTILVWMDEVVNYADISILYENPKEYASITAHINGTDTDREVGQYDFTYNIDLLRYKGYALSDQLMNSLIGMSVMVIVIIMFTSIFCIRNSFAISIAEKTRQYGMLSSMGATSKQIRKNVLFEALLLWLVGVLAGILGATLAVHVLIGIVQALLEGAAEEGLEFVAYIHPMGLLVGAGLSLLTVYLSAYSSARKASKISEIEAMRHSVYIKNTKRSLKTPWWIGKVFRVGGIFAYKNMKRNRKKFRTTVISLTVSIATFISMSYFVQIGYGSAEEAYEVQGYHLSLWTNGEISASDAEQLWEQVVSFEEVESSWIMKVLYVSTEEGVEEIWSIPDDLYEEYLRYLGVEEDQSEQGIFVLNTEEQIELGETRIVSGVVEETEHALTLEVTETGKVPVFAPYLHDVIVISESRMEEFGHYRISMVALNTGDVEATLEKARPLVEELGLQLGINDAEEQMELMNNILLLISIFLYGFIGVIILIGMTNIFNAITTNMQLRRREFAILQSIGMTKKEFVRMIRLESIFYGAKSLVFGLPLGILGSWLIYSSAVIGVSEHLTYKLPIVSILQCVVVVFVVVYIMMKSSLAKIEKQNIIETIRNENI